MFETKRTASTDPILAPSGVRRIGRAVLVVLLAGAIYLIAVRRDAILIDIANLAAWCF